MFLQYQHLIFIHLGDSLDSVAWVLASKLVESQLIVLDAPYIPILEKVIGILLIIKFRPVFEQLFILLLCG